MVGLSGVFVFMSDDDGGWMNLVMILGIWITIVAIATRAKAQDSAKLKLAKRIMLHVFTATLVLCVLLAAWALYYVKVMK